MLKCLINSQDFYVDLMLKNKLKILSSIRVGFLPGKTNLLDYWTIILVSFPLGCCIDQ